MKKQVNNQKIRVGILGASGYTGADLVRLLQCHDHADIVLLTAHSQADLDYGTIYPSFAHCDLPTITTIDHANDRMYWRDCDVIFCALPHGTTQEYVPNILNYTKVIDLSADFRLRDGDIYAQWYGKPHQAIDTQKQAIYGLSEFYRHDIEKANLIACPGCYPTASLLALLPLLSEKAITTEMITIDAKSGVTGAGRSVKQSNLFCEISDAIHPYGITKHRHMPEIEQELSRIAQQDVTISFTPHLVPMNRGELLTIYVTRQDGITNDDLYQIYKKRYDSQPFIHVCASDHIPATRHVRGSNYCFLNVFPDRIKNRSIIIATLDNLVKGSSGQAIQNMNIAFGLPETTALQQLPLFP